MDFVNFWQRPVTLGSADVALSLDLPNGDYRLVITDAPSFQAATVWEVIGASVTAGAGTLTRGLEGTIARTWPVGSIILCSITAGGLADLAAATAVAAGTSAWGGITGTLADQTDLQAALDSKATGAQGALADTAVQPADLSTYERSLTAGANVTIDRTDPASPIISASVSGGGGGDVVGPVSAADNQVALFDGTTGKLIKAGGLLGTAAAAATGDFVPAAHAGAGGAEHASVVAAGAAGFMTGADKTKLDGIAAGATANATNADLRDRATHTGTQAQSTVTDLTTDLAAKITNPMTTAADLIVGGASGVPARLAKGAALQVLRVNAGATALEYADPASGASLPVIRAIAANETLGLSNINTVGVNSTASNYTSTIPAQATVVWTADAELHFLPTSTGTITVTAAAGVTLNGATSGSLTLSTQYGAATLKRTGTNAWWCGGALGTLAEQRAALGVGGPFAKNKVINGAMAIAQEGTSFTGIAAPAATFVVDQFKVVVSGATAVVTGAQSADVPADLEFNNSLSVTVTTADATVDAADFVTIRQPIEGYDVRDLIGKTFTISFRVRSAKTGIHCVKVGNSNNDRNYLFEYTINAANTWETKSLKLDGGLITAGTWNWTNGVGVLLDFILMAGSNFQAAAGVWNTSSKLATANQVNCMDTIGNVFAVTGVQIEVGAVATPFEHRPYGHELALCQRHYFERNARSLANVLTTGFAADILYPVTMRAAPTLSTTLTDANFVNASPAAGQWGTQVAGVSVVTRAGTIALAFANTSDTRTTLYCTGATFSGAGNWIATGDDTMKVKVSARL